MVDADEPIPTMEVGATGGDLPYWRLKEAVRHAELRLGGQAQTAQALEGRATALLGWNVTGLLLLGAAVANGTHRVPAVIAAALLAGAAGCCVSALVTRNFEGVAGYAPYDLLYDAAGDTKASEYEVLASIAKGYQKTIESNVDAIGRFKQALTRAMFLMSLSPACGLLALFSRTA